MRVSNVVLCLAVLCIAQVALAAEPAVTSGSVTSAISDADSVLADVRAAEARYAALQQRQVRAQDDMDSFWLVASGVLVLLAQAGYMLYELSAVRPVSQGSVAYKVVLSAAVTTVSWWLFGWALAYGSNTETGTRNGFIGNGDFILVSDGDAMSGRRYGRFFFEWTYALIPTTIVTLAVAERLKPAGIMAIAVVVSGVVYPVVAHWVWSDAGFLSPISTLSTMGTRGMYDFAGSATLFLLSGSAGLAVAIAVGARTDRFEKPEVFAARNKVFAVSGAFLLVLSFFAITVGRTTRAFGPSGANVASKAIINVVLGIAGGYLGGFPLSYLRITATSADVTVMTDCLLAGFAAVASGASFFEPWAAFVTGIVAGILYFAFRGIIQAVKIDDAFNGFAVYGITGYWGLVATGLMATQENVRRTYGIPGSVHYGLFYEGNGEMLWVQLVAGLIILLWAFVVTFVVVKPLAMAGLVRVSVDEEKFGIDLAVYTEMQVTEAVNDVARDAWSAKLKSAPASEE
eukprot:PhM_4_TR1897/c1_g1_i1/m.38057/K03320/amt, AMT, MEP; ammonium transporter, Amt family